MRPYRERKEVKLIPCSDCKGKGSVKEHEDDNEKSMCLRCGGSGEIIEKIIPLYPIRPGRRIIKE